MRIAFIEANAITNEVLRAYAGAHRLCCGYPDGVPETWRTVSAAQQEGGAVPDLPMKHFTDETRGYPEHELDPLDGDRLIQAKLAREAASKDLAELRARFGLWSDGTGAPDSARARDWQRYVSYSCEGELDPAALLGPAAESVDWPEMDQGIARVASWHRAMLLEGILPEVAARVSSRVADTMKIAQSTGDYIAYWEAVHAAIVSLRKPAIVTDEPVDWPERDAAGDEEC